MSRKPSVARASSFVENYGGLQWRASFARSVALRLFFALQKKSTDSKPDGLPSVALAKDGGEKGTRTLDPHTASVML